MKAIPWRIDCAPEFRLPARYTITMLGLIAGFVPRFIEHADADGGEPYCVYGTGDRRHGYEANSGALAASQPAVIVPDASDNTVLLRRTGLQTADQPPQCQP